MSYGLKTATGCADILCESITPIVVGRYHVRIWREESDPHGYNINDLVSAVTELTGLTNLAMIAETIIKMERVNAVEVVDQHTKRGVVLYADWP